MALAPPQSTNIKKNQTVVEGAYLTRPLLYSSPEVVGVDPIEYDLMHITKSNRDLQRILGLDLQSASPMSGYTFVEHLQRWRDSEIDKLIAKHRLENDPMARSTDVSSIVIPSKGRERMFETAKIPKVGPLVHPAFQGAYGADLG